MKGVGYGASGPLRGQSPYIEGDLTGSRSGRRGVLQEADDAVSGERRENYGEPIDDFTRTGRLWAAILGVDEVTPEQVGLCMIAVKISREVHQPKRDNLVDIAGYAATLEAVMEGRHGDVGP